MDELTAGREAISLLLNNNVKVSGYEVASKIKLRIRLNIQNAVLIHPKTYWRSVKFFKLCLI